MKKLLIIMIAWSVQTTVFAQYWQQNGTSIYYSGGNVGIGTFSTAPQADLHISRANTSTNLLIENTQSASNTFPGININNYRGAGLGHPYIMFNNANGSLTTPAALSSSLLGALVFSGHNGSGFIQAGRIEVQVASAFTATSTPTNILFSTTNTNATSYSEKMRITSEGFVGIGTNSPGYALSILGTTQNMLSVKSSSHSIIDVESGSGLNSYLRFTNNGVNKWDMASETTGNLRFYDYTNGTIRMAITPSGYVGIGTSAPSQKLDVAGNGNFNGGSNPSELTLVSDSWSAFKLRRTGFWLEAEVALAASNGNHSPEAKPGDLIIRTESGGRNILFNTNGGNTAATMTIVGNKVGIGNINPDAELTVTGQVHAKEVKVTVNAPGPDYVFEKDYALPSLDQIKTYIEENKHLPEVPSAKEMEKNGVQLGEMNMLLLKKIEELTLYVIELKKENDSQKTENRNMQKQIDELKSQLR